jgi:hypothetical protein
MNGPIVTSKARRTVRKHGLASVILSAAVVMAPAGHAFAQGGVVRVPRAPGQVYVPLDASGRPVVPQTSPGEPGVPAGAVAPGVPAVPTAPSPPSAPTSSILPLPPGWALLTLEVEPVNANVLLDGESLGPITAGTGGGRTIAIAPGFHRIEMVAAGFRPASTTIAFVSGQNIAVRLSLQAEGPSAQLETGYYVLPRALPAPVPSRSGGGYFIVPAP